MKQTRVPDTKLERFNMTPEERVVQARLRLLAAAKMGNKNLLLAPSRKTIGMPAVALALVAGFISGFYPAISKAISRQAPSLLQLWLGRRMNR